MKPSEPTGPAWSDGWTLAEGLAGSLEPVLVTAPAGHLLYLNPAGERLFGVAFREVSGKHWMELRCLTAEGQASLSETALALLAGQPADQSEVEVVRNEKERSWWEVRGYPLSREGQVLALQWWFRDRTECRQLRERLRLSQRMEAVGRMATGLAHDYNNVLTVIKGYTEVLLLKPKLGEDAVKYLRSMGTAGERGANLTRQLLTFARRQVIQRRPCDVNELISNVTQMLRRLVGEQITLQFRYQPSLPAVSADVGMFEQVISNLVLNARDTLPAGGVVTIATTLEVITRETAVRPPQGGEGAYVCVSVRDEGACLDAATLAQLLEPPPPHAAPERAPRLGLQIANYIVQQHHGWVEAQSGPERGNTLRVYLPALSERVPASAATPSLAPVQGGSETILVVEDEPSIRELAKCVLLGYGYRVLEASDGPEAIVVWEKQGGRVDLLFTDMVMPAGLTGRELAQELETRKPALKVLYTTGYSLDLLQSDIALKPGFNLLSKPYSASDLARAIRQTLDRK